MAEWFEHLARYMDYDMAVIDPATASASASQRIDQ